MNREEIERISAENHWAYGSVGAEFWDEFNMVYLYTELTKEEVTYLYWMKTGTYERIALAVKKFIEQKAELKVICAFEEWTADNLNCASCEADAFAERAIELRDAVAHGKELFANRVPRNRRPADGNIA